MNEACSPRDPQLFEGRESFGRLVSLVGWKPKLFRADQARCCRVRAPAAWWAKDMFITAAVLTVLTQKS